MGSEIGTHGEQPVHEVTVNSFYIAKHEVTVADFRAFVADTGYTTIAEIGNQGSHAWSEDYRQCRKTAGVNWRNPCRDQDDTHPVLHLRLDDAVAYCNWLSQRHGLEKCYALEDDSVTCDFDEQGYRLPTEAEWEYAARGGRLSKGYKYSGSNNPREVAWYGRSPRSGGTTHPVGTKKANELGIHDMSGNVWEWCWDPEDAKKVYYSRSPKDNPKGLQGNRRVRRYTRASGIIISGASNIRGGGWGSSRDAIRCARRKGEGHPSPTIGFRVVRTAE